MRRVGVLAVPKVRVPVTPVEDATLRIRMPVTVKLATVMLLKDELPDMVIVVPVAVVSVKLTLL